MYRIGVSSNSFAVDFHHELYPQAKEMLAGGNPLPGAGFVPLVGGNPVWPPFAVALAGPLTVLPISTAEIVMAVLGLLLFAAALLVAGVRDWRVFGACALWPQVAGEMRAAWSNAETSGDRLQEPAQAGAASASAGAGAPAPTADEQVLAERLIGALGGANNIRSLSTCASRLRVETVDASPVREADIRKLRIRGLVRAAGNALHIIIGPCASAVEAGMRSLM